MSLARCFAALTIKTLDHAVTRFLETFYEDWRFIAARDHLCSHMPSFKDISTKRKIKLKIENILVVTGFLLLSNGAATVLLGSIAAFYIFYPTGLSNSIFLKNRYFIKGMGRNILAIIILISCLFFAFHFGNRIKQGNFTSIDTRRTNHISDKYLATLVGRVSSYYDSLLFTSSPNYDRVNLYSNRYIVTIFLDSIIYRLSKLGLPLNDERPEIVSLSRLNYLNLSLTRLNSREGSSPGLIASFDYMLPFPISIFLCSLYLVFISRIFDRLSCNKERGITWFGALIMFLFVQVFFQSPFDLLNIIDNGFLMAFSFYIMSFHRKSEAYLNVKMDLVPTN
jgi:hypothetical protein